MPLYFILIAKHFRTKTQGSGSQKYVLVCVRQTAHELFCGTVEYLWVQSHVAPRLVATAANLSLFLNVNCCQI